MIELHVPTGEILIRDALPIQVTGLQTGQWVTLETRTAPFDACAAATFVADESGAVDTAAQAPVDGNYDGSDVTGLIWAAQLPADRDFRDVLEGQDAAPTLETTIMATVDGREQARATVLRRPYPSSVERIPVRYGRLRGALFRPVGAGNAPQVLVVGGSTGGCYELPAAVLAAEGFAALALAYFAYDDLPPALIDIPLEYFAEAVDYLQRLPGAESAPIGVLGQSRGGELALLLGATFPQFQAVVALVPSAVLMSAQAPDGTTGPASWTYRGEAVGQPLGVPFDADWLTAMGAVVTGTPLTVAAPLAGAPMTSAALSAAAATAEGALIPVEQTRGPILLVSGTDDAMWPSVQLCDLAEQRLAESGFAHLVEHIRYQGAGHTAAVTPGFPTTRNWLTHAQFPFPMAVGGTPRETALAQADAWRRIPAFLHEQLSTAPQ
jgi:dienelactone hydrolase